MIRYISEMNEQNNIVFFDGVCNLCNSSIDFLVRHNRKRNLRFASLQSDFAKEFLADHPIDQKALESVLYFTNGKLYQKSNAILHIALELPFFFRLAYVFIIIPKGIRDSVYSWIARNRYRWYGKKETCRLPTPEERALFLG